MSGSEYFLCESCGVKLRYTELAVLDENRPVVHCSKCYRLLQAENEKLKEFARRVIKIECWSIYEQDGCDIQELAERLGLIAKHTATEADVNPDYDDFEVGDIIYKFTEILKGGE